MRQFRPGELGLERQFLEHWLKSAPKNHGQAGERSKPLLEAASAFFNEVHP